MLLGSISQNLGSKTSLYLTGGASSVGGCFSRFQQQTRAKSLVRMCSEISANSPEFSKGIFRNGHSQVRILAPQPASAVSAV